MTTAVTARSRPILVTGAHRSGSTWVGRMIASSRAVRYVHEPFNPKAFDPDVCALRFEREFTHVCDENADPYRDALARCLSARPTAPWGEGDSGTPAALIRRTRTTARAAVERLRGRRTLMKDPHAVFSADWLARSFGMDVVVTVRHPAAFVGSIKQAGWWFDFGQLLEQPRLMARALAPYRGEIEQMTAAPHDLVEQASLLWNLIHHVIAHYRDRHPEWVIVRHEDLSRDPVAAFGELFRRLGLVYTRRCARVVADFSAPGNPIEPHAESAIRRDSRANVQSWRQRLTAEEIDRVRDRTSKVSSQFYGATDW